MGRTLRDLAGRVLSLGVRDVADTFFEEQTEQSLVKAEIISKYFWAWAKVIIGAETLR